MIHLLKSFLIPFFMALLLLSSTVSASNSLKDNPSPYLAMHGDDPVQWQGWSPDVLEQAQREGKLVYLSIGYFSCRWCHVMQRESYSDAAVGALLNKYFIPVKVDRELRPELDRRMIRFVEAVRGQAGWPLNVFITPDGYPVTGFTYLPRDNFYKALQRLQKEWLARSDELSALAKQYFEQTESSESRSSLISVSQQNRDKTSNFFIAQAMAIADELEGGFGETTKFPSYPQLDALMKLAADDKNIAPEVVQFIQLTLDNMARKHLLDHINGGFFRYSTDPGWQTPHYEKMLYDNAQLASLYLDADTIWPDRGYAQIGLGTLDFMRRFLLDKDGGYNASLSAVDENHQEGGGYMWTKQQLQQALDDKEYAHLVNIWQLDQIEQTTFPAGPLTGIGSDADDHALNQRIQQKLRKVKKPRMPVDSKRLASWNALVLNALVKAQAFDSGKQRKRQMDELYHYIVQHFVQRGEQGELQVIRFSGQGQSAETTLEDYANLAAAIQSYAKFKHNPSAEQLAQQLARQALAKYFRNGRWFQNNASLIPGDQGEFIIQDDVLQSSSSVLLKTLNAMPQLDKKLRKQIRQLILRLTRDELDTPYYYASSILLAHQLEQHSTIKTVIPAK